MKTAAVCLLPVNQFDHFYRGGDRIGALRAGPGGPQRPEEWLGSTTVRFGQAPAGLSSLPDGTLLVDAIAADPQAWLGSAHLDRYGPSIEVLVKFLDLGQRLPVHLHPNRSFARQHLGLAHGKTEAWYVLDAPPGARVGVGFATPPSRTELAQWVRAYDSQALLDALCTREVRPGDAMLVPAGLPHTVSDGVFVLELQEPTDLSILLEWADFAVDGDQDGHLDLGFDIALQAVDLAPISATDLDRLVVPATALAGAGLRSVLPTQADPYFRALRADTSGGPVSVPAGFAIVVVLQGAGELVWADGSQPVRRGEVALVPFAVGPWQVVDGGAEPVVAMVCAPPSVDAPYGAP